jgi:ParB/RepB/Spo0J family partition protein
MQTATPVPPSLLFLPLRELKESPLNPRTHFDPDKLAELAESMKGGIGIVEPLVARPVNGHLEIVAGARRFRAAKLAGLEEVPVLKRELTDVQTLELMVIENGQRDNLDPIEEAQGFRALISLNPGKYSALSIADRIGRSEKYVWDRMKLLDLVPDAKQHLEHGRISAGHAILIARLKPADQKRVIQRAGGGLWQHHNGLEFDDQAEKPGAFDTVKACSVRELEEWIATHIRFDVAHMAAAAPLDFGPVAAAVGKAIATPGRGKKLVSITYDYNAQSEAASAGEERTYGNTAWRRADGREGSKPCEHAILGVVVAGRHYGQSFQVCIAREKCDVHWKAERQERERTAKMRASGKVTQAARRESNAEAKRKAEAAQEQQTQAVWQKAERDLLLAVAAKVQSLKLPALIERAYAAAAVNDAKRSSELLVITSKKPTADDVLRILVMDRICEDFGTYKFERDDFTRTAKELGIDVTPIVKKHTAEAVQPSAVGKKKARA